MKRMLVIAIVTFVLNGCVAIIESHGPRGFGEPGWVRPPTISVCDPILFLLDSRPR